MFTRKLAYKEGWEASLPNPGLEKIARLDAFSSWPMSILVQFSKNSIIVEKKRGGD